MKLEQIINEKAKEYAFNEYKEVCNDYATRESEDFMFTKTGSDFDGFVKGANLMLSLWKEAERWRDVNEELPEINKTVLVKDVGGYYFSAHISIHGWINNERAEYMTHRRITHWKPIESELLTDKQ